MKKKVSEPANNAERMRAMARGYQSLKREDKAKLFKSAAEVLERSSKSVEAQQRI